MSGSTFQPPIHLDPNQVADQQTAFINQNFQTLASALETNSFRVVISGTTSVTTTGNPVDWVTIPHNLGFTPIPFGFLNNVTITSGTSTITSNGSLPLPTWTSVTVDTILAAATSSGVDMPIVGFHKYVQVIADSSNVIILLLNAAGTSGSTYNVTYYLTQQAAT